MNSRQGKVGGEVIITTLRLPKGLRDAMKHQAARAGRSFNTHVAMILDEAAGAEFGDATPAAGKVHSEVNHRGAHSHVGE